MIAAIAAAASIWSRIRQRQTLRKLLDSLTKEQRAELEKHLRKDA